MSEYPLKVRISTEGQNIPLTMMLSCIPAMMLNFITDEAS